MGALPGTRCLPQPQREEAELASHEPGCLGKENAEIILRF